MWLFIKSLFMVKDPTIAKDMVDWHEFEHNPAGFRLRLISKRRIRRGKFRANNTTQLKSKVR